MAYNTKKILRDRNGDPIPQYYDSDGDRYVPSEIDTRLKAIENQQQEILERLDKPIDTQVTGSNVEYPNDYPDANAGERLEAIEQTQESIINALQTTNENLNNVIDDDSLLTNSKPAKTFSFLTEVSPKTQKIIKESEIGDEINFGDLRQFKAFYFCVDSGPISGETSSHGFMARVFFKTMGSDGYIADIHEKEVSKGLHAFIPKTDFNLHKGSFRVVNNSDEVQKYMITMGLFYS